MTPNEVIQKLMRVPYVLGGSDWKGADCWGIIELAYKHILGIELPNRASIKPGPLGLYRGYKKQKNFIPILEGEAKDYDILMMRSYTSRRGFRGHCGLVFSKHILHSDVGVGPAYERLNSPAIVAMKEALIRHVDLY